MDEVANSPVDGAGDWRCCLALGPAQVAHALMNLCGRRCQGVRPDRNGRGRRSDGLDLVDHTGSHPAGTEEFPVEEMSATNSELVVDRISSRWPMLDRLLLMKSK